MQHLDKVAATRTAFYNPVGLTSYYGLQKKENHQKRERQEATTLLKRILVLIARPVLLAKSLARDDGAGSCTLAVTSPADLDVISSG